jgi:hypothetical protein
MRQTQGHQSTLKSSNDPKSTDKPKHSDTSTPEYHTFTNR